MNRDASWVSLIRLQWIRSWKPIVWSFAVVLAALSVAVVAKLKWNIPPEHLLRDGIALLEAPLYTGVLSNVGVLLWCSTAAVCFFCGALLRRTSRELFWFWTGSGALTSALLLDDFFLLHEAVYPRYLGIPEILVYTVYAIALVGLPLRFHKTVLRTDFLIVLLAAGFFAASLGVDALDGVVEIRGFYVFEDGFKLLGITSWFLYFTRTAYEHLSVLVASPSGDSPS